MTQNKNLELLPEVSDPNNPGANMDPATAAEMFPEWADQQLASKAEDREIKRVQQSVADWGDISDEQIVTRQGTQPYVRPIPVQPRAPRQPHTSAW
jgi:hypothetical protein